MMNWKIQRDPNDAGATAGFEEIDHLRASTHSRHWAPLHQHTKTSKR